MVTSIDDPVEKTKSFIDSSANLAIAQVSTPGSQSQFDVSKSKSDNKGLELMQKKLTGKNYMNSPQHKKIKELKNLDLPIEVGEYTFPKDNEDTGNTHPKKTNFSDLVMKVKNQR